MARDPSPGYLVSLPQELLEVIASHLSSNTDDLNNLTKTCHHFHSHLTHLIYRKPISEDGGWSLLYYAAEKNNTALLLRLLNTFGVSPSTQQPLTGLYSHGSPNALHVAAAHGSIDVARILIQRGVHADAAISLQKFRPLDLSCIGPLTVFRRDLVLWDPDSGSETPGRVETVRLLLEVSLPRRPCVGTWTPLLLALRFGFPQIASVVLQHCSSSSFPRLSTEVNQITECGYTALGLCYRRIQDGLYSLERIPADLYKEKSTHEKRCMIRRWVELAKTLINSGAELEYELQHHDERWLHALRADVKRLGFADIYGREEWAEKEEEELSSEDESTGVEE